jgi:RNA polymerase sigma factor (sigma-70 family)
MAEEDFGMIQGLIQREAWAQERLVRKFGPRLYRVLKGLTRDAEHAEDLVQETLIRVLGRIASYDPVRGSFWSFLVAHAYSVHRDWVRKENRVIFADLEQAEDMMAVEVDVPSCSSERARIFQQALGCLSAEEQGILRSCYLSGRHSEVVAGWFGLSMSALKQKKYRAVMKLRVRMQGMEVFRDLFAMSPVEETPLITEEGRSVQEVRLAVEVPAG